MQKFIVGLILISINSSLYAQTPMSAQTGKWSGIFESPLFSSTTKEDLGKMNWDISFQTIHNEEEDQLGMVRELKERKNELKRKAAYAVSAETGLNKTTGANPTIGTNFKGNELKSWTPTDNTVAVSNGGKIISCVNYGIEYYDTAGTYFLQNQTWSNFVNNAALNQAKFDPRVVYDQLHDRFIVVLLHGFSSSKSKVLVCFSKTNDPVDGWNIYQLSGNPYQDSSWTDYPTIGVSDDDLFINGNRFGDAPNYLFKGTYIYQISLSEGYAGTNLQYGLWNQIYTPGGLEGLTLYPAADGQGRSMKQKMYFVQLLPDTGSHVYLYTLEGKLKSSTKTLTATEYKIPYYELCGNAFEKDPTTGDIDSLSTGSAWTQNAFYNHRHIHFSFTADIGNGWCGVHYGRILLDSGRVEVRSIGEEGTDLAYPAVASFGYDSLDQGAVLAYVQSDTNHLPNVGVVSINDSLVWSGRQTVKAGDTSVNILYPPAYAIQPERWGDYTGICRKFNSPVPQAWLAAAYATNTPPRLASYGTWIAQIITADPPLPPPVPASTSQVENSTRAILFPNPASSLFTLEFENATPGNIVVSLYDMQGRLVKILFNDFLKQSSNKLSFNQLMLASGKYVLKVEREGKTMLTKALLIQ